MSAYFYSGSDSLKVLCRMTLYLTLADATKALMWARQRNKKKATLESLSTTAAVFTCHAAAERNARQALRSGLWSEGKIKITA